MGTGGGRVCKLSVPSAAGFVSWSTVIGALALSAACFFAIFITGRFSYNVDECSTLTCERDRAVAVETALGAYAVHGFLFFLASLIFAAELRVPCNKHFGFLTHRIGRGLPLMVGGLIVATYSRVLIRSFELSGATAHDSSYVETACGAVTFLAGLLNLFCGLPCCKCAHVSASDAPPPAAFDPSHETPRKATKRAQPTNGPVPTVTATLADPETGDCKTPRSRPLSLTKGRKAGGSAAKTTSTADNPFYTASTADNPFLAHNGGQHVPPNPFLVAGGAAGVVKVVERC